MWRLRILAMLACAALAGCVQGSCCSGPVDAGRAPDAAPLAEDAAAPTEDAALMGDDAASPTSARDRLLASYLAFLRTTPDTAQSNGLRGADLPDVCALWDALDPSSRATYLTLTARLEGSHLGADGSSALDHLVRLYRVTGGQGASATDHGSCGGGEYNRMIVSIDTALHDALVATSDHAGASPFDLADVVSGHGWRDSHDLAGPHAPFDLSDETNDGAPRGQTQFFRDPTSSAATSPLGRLDLETLVDPFAMEFDQDYDCIHSSNPSCSYVTYGPACLPMASKTGVEIYGDTYGAIDLAWRPTGCP